MNYVKIISLSLAIILLLFIACALKQAPPQKPTEKTVLTVGDEKKAPEGWRAEWERIMTAARKEGRVVVYTGGGSEPARTPIIQAFKSRYNLDVEWTTARAALASAKIASERRGGLYIVDVYIGSAKRLLQTDKPGGHLDPLEPALILPEVLDEKNWWGNQLRWIDKDRTILTPVLYVNTPVLINTNLVREEEIKSWSDILNPKWTGKIVMDDPLAGGTTTQLMFALGESIMGWDFVRQLARQSPIIIMERNLILQWVARGKYPLALMTTGAEEFIKAGAPIEEIVPVEGTYLSSGSGSISLINKAPHPNASRIFINWFLTKEGQTIYSTATAWPSARLDTPKDMFDPRKIIKPGVKYAFTDTEEYIEKRIKFEEVLGKEIFGRLLR